MFNKLSEETILRIAELSRLQLDSEDVALYQKDLSIMLDAFSTLMQIPIPAELQDGSRSALTVVDCEGCQTEELSRLRPDDWNNSLSTEKFLNQCPDREGVFTRVPAVLTSSH